LLGSLFAGLDQWAETAAAFDDDLALNERLLQDGMDRDRIVQVLAHASTLARWTAYAHVRSGDPQTTVKMFPLPQLERGFLTA
jgi:hypothetical protein